MKRKPCPRMEGRPSVLGEDFEYLNRPEDFTCTFCGSLDADIFMQRLEQGDCSLDPTDKNYKVYIHNVGGKPFLQTYRVDKPAGIGEIVKDPKDQSLWKWTCREVQETKFYFQHLSTEQKKRFIELLNQKKLNINYPGYFYRTPFFIYYGKSDENQK